MGSAVGKVRASPQSSHRDSNAESTYGNLHVLWRRYWYVSFAKSRVRGSFISWKPKQERMGRATPKHVSYGVYPCILVYTARLEWTGVGGGGYKSCLSASPSQGKKQSANGALRPFMSSGEVTSDTLRSHKSRPISSHVPRWRFFMAICTHLKSWLRKFVVGYVRGKALFRCHFITVIIILERSACCRVSYRAWWSLLRYCEVGTKCKRGRIRFPALVSERIYAAQLLNAVSSLAKKGKTGNKRQKQRNKNNKKHTRAYAL